MRRALAIIAGVLALPSVLSAQRPESSVILASGVQGVGFPVDPSFGLVLQAGYALQYDRLALRVGGTYFRCNRDFSGGESLRPRALGATLELSYDIVASRFRPYVIGGWGLYRLTDTQVNALGTYHVDQLSPAMLGGLGFRYQLRSAETFIEGRLHAFTAGGNWGSAFMPVTAGIRF